ncbi:quinone oxidoreductase-like protein 2 [Capsaspora owczarzaki ATCC 30864]|uniref:Quinone oxidoreductase-like protein 2 n=1 Tax=Capsaspora owczarzaki (strain ATCC 30864) TaxID=595528 RepID=A0A0D2VK99_CAPO3|nr:quinone oxidoreductase-like protein 2 [Capsaspora owczarzaki ATCC 30864]KJE90442.1 quinone oxidoreductase-like protein 2 [Capsaspora owczarzaki ATCC 30864]|eukprot:XP_004364621.1 quinone oxidoreductase-like protein 2 [Capsaspora owczarzaki ATCC 30864]
MSSAVGHHEALLRPLLRSVATLTATTNAAMVAAKGSSLAPSSALSASFSTCAASSGVVSSAPAASSSSSSSASSSSSSSSSKPNKPSSIVRAAVCSELKAPLTLSADYSPAGHPLVAKISPEKRVRIGIRACGVNFADTLMVEGLYQVKPPLPFVPGAEIAGIVLETGSAVKSVKIGDHVIALLDGGGFATECIAHEAQVYALPKTIAFGQAAALPVSYGTAITALSYRAQTKPGETVLITAAAGGVGLASIELAKRVLGAKVIACAGGAEKLAVCQAKGADHVIDYNKESIKDRVKEITNGKGVNVVIEVVGGDTFDQCLRSLAPEGRLVVIGFASGSIPSIPANLTLVKNIAVLGLYWGGYQAFNPSVLRNSIKDVIKHCEAGHISPVVSATYPLDQVNDAFALLRTRKSTGKVVVTMNE